MPSFKESSLTKITFNPDAVDPNYPLIIDDVTLAMFLRLRTKTLWYLLHQRNTDEAYNCFSIPRFTQSSRNGKKIRLSNREIQEPLGLMKIVHKKLNKLFSSIPLDISIAAYMKGRNCADAARRHVRHSHTVPLGTIDEALELDHRYAKTSVPSDPTDTKSPQVTQYYQPLCMIKMDISNFFPSIKTSWIRNYLKEEVGYSHYAAGLIASLCTVKRLIKRPGCDVIETRHLPQGSPLSGALANLVAYHRFGKRLLEMLRTHSSDWVITIYSDDIIMTHPSLTLDDTEANSIKNRVETLITNAEFKINAKKTLVRRSHHGKIKILGCVVTTKLNIPASVRKDIGHKLHLCKTLGFVATCPANRSVGNYLMYLRGIIEYIKSVRPDLAAKYTVVLQDAKTKFAHEIEQLKSGGFIHEYGKKESEKDK